MAAQCSSLRPASAPGCTPGVCEQDRNRFHAILARIAIAQALAAHCTAAVSRFWNLSWRVGAFGAKEPLNKSRVAATDAFRDEMREATRGPWQAPMGERRDKADRPESPVPHVGLVQRFLNPI